MTQAAEELGIKTHDTPFGPGYRGEDGDKVLDRACDIMNPETEEEAS